MHTDENKFRDKLYDEELYELYALGVVWCGLLSNQKC